MEPWKALTSSRLVRFHSALVLNPTPTSASIAFHQRDFRSSRKSVNRMPSAKMASCTWGRMSAKSFCCRNQSNKYLSISHYLGDAAAEAAAPPPVSAVAVAA